MTSGQYYLYEKHLQGQSDIPGQMDWLSITAEWLVSESLIHCAVATESLTPAVNIQVVTGPSRLQ